MNTTKLREALDDLQSQRIIVDDAIAKITAVLSILEGGGSMPVNIVATPPRSSPEEPSYIDHTAAVVREAGRPLHINEIAKAVSARTGVNLKRAGLESSISRHIKKAKEKKLIKVGPSTYSVPDALPHSQPLLLHTA